MYKYRVTKEPSTHLKLTWKWPRQLGDHDYLVEPDRTRDYHGKNFVHVLGWSTLAINYFIVIDGFMDKNYLNPKSMEFSVNAIG